MPVYGDEAIPQAFFGGPAVSRGRMLVASDRVFCLDADTGATLWETEPLRTPASDDYFWGPPVPVGPLVLVGSGSGSEAAATRGRLTAYDLGSGALRWSTPMVPPDGNGGGVMQPSTVDIRHGRAYVATGSPYVTVPGPNPGTCSLVELDVRDGRVLWQDQLHPHDGLGFDLNSAVVIAGRLLVAAGKDGVHAWDRLARRRLWHRQLTPAETTPGAGAGPTNGPENGTLAFDGHRLYVLSNDDANGRHAAAALDPRTGAVLWQQWLGGFAFAAPAVADGFLYSTSSEGTLTALRTRDGQVAATGALGNPSTGAVSLAFGSVLAGTGAGVNLAGRGPRLLRPGLAPPS